MSRYSTHDRSIIKLLEYLEFDPNRLLEIYLELEIDKYSGRDDMSEFKKARKIYRSAHASIEKAKSHLSDLSNFEKVALTLSRSTAEIFTRIDQSLVDLKAVISAREQRISNNQTRGGRDARADKIAELVAKVLIEKKRPITFGISAHDANEPSTDFGRGVKKAFEILNVTEGGNIEKAKIWRYPAKRAFEKYKKC